MIIWPLKSQIIYTYNILQSQNQIPSTWRVSKAVALHLLVGPAFRLLDAEREHLLSRTEVSTPKLQERNTGERHRHGEIDDLRLRFDISWYQLVPFKIVWCHLIFLTLESHWNLLLDMISRKSYSAMLAEEQCGMHCWHPTLEYQEGWRVWLKCGLPTFCHSLPQQVGQDVTFV